MGWIKEGSGAVSSDHARFFFPNPARSFFNDWYTVAPPYTMNEEGE